MPEWSLASFTHILYTYLATNSSEINTYKTKKKKKRKKKHVNRFNPKVLCCIQLHLEVCGKLN